MSDSGKISDQGRSALRQILYLRDYYDYAQFLENGDAETNTNSPLGQEISALFREQGIFATLKAVLERFNSNPADVQAAIKLFNLPAGESITARDLAAAALDRRDGHDDLRAALLRVKNSSLTAPGKALLSQILYIRDLFDYDTFLKEGDPAKGRPSPLDPAVIALFRDQGLFIALKTVLDLFNGNPADVSAAIKLFSLPAGAEIKARDLGAQWLKNRNDSSDLQATLVRLETAAPGPSAPAPSIAHKTAKSAYKDDRDTDYVNEWLENAFLSDLRRDLGQAGTPMSLSGSAVVTVQIGTDGSVAVTGVVIKTPFAITFVSHTDEDIIARIKDSLNNVTLPGFLCGDKPLIHSLVIGSQQ